MRAILRALALLLPVLLAACGGGGRAVGSLVSGGVECAPYARQVSGIQLRGAAYTWWAGAEGRYGRAASPSPGSVLVFRRSERLPYGHVSVVSRVVSPRSILVTQANWVRGRIARDEPVIDVSAGNDWTAVRVWWAPAGGMGSGTYATYGFVTPGFVTPGFDGPGFDRPGFDRPGAPAPVPEPSRPDAREWMARAAPSVRVARAWAGLTPSQ